MNPIYTVIKEKQLLPNSTWAIVEKIRERNQWRNHKNLCWRSDFPWSVFSAKNDNNWNKLTHTYVQIYFILLVNWNLVYSLMVTECVARKFYYYFPWRFWSISERKHGSIDLARAVACLSLDLIEVAQIQLSKVHVFSEIIAIFKYLKKKNWRQGK